MPAEWNYSYADGDQYYRCSPDGKWIVYNAAEDGRQQVYLVPVPPTGERWQVSTAGGAQGRWRADGGGILINLQFPKKPVRSWPVHQRPAVVGGSARVTEPDSALGLDLLQLWQTRYDVIYVGKTHQLLGRRLLSVG